jgi:hypothetical protein
LLAAALAVSWAPKAWAVEEASASAGGGPYRVDVWADALFGSDGKIERLEVPEAAQYPPAFVERLKKQFATARIPPVKADDGSPASFQTGVGLYILITPGAEGGTVRVESVKVSPRPIKRYFASRPDTVPSDSVAEAQVRCVVGVEGQCTEVELLSAVPNSESFRRWGIASIQGWRFEPQRVNGRPVSGEYSTRLRLEVVRTAPHDFREPRKL